MQVKPLRENVLIKRVEEENKTAGGIILPDTAKEKPSEGIVIAAGEGHTFRFSNRPLSAISVWKYDSETGGRY